MTPALPLGWFNPIALRYNFGLSECNMVNRMNTISFILQVFHALFLEKSCHPHSQRQVRMCVVTAGRSLPVSPILIFIADLIQDFVHMFVLCVRKGSL